MWDKGGEGERPPGGIGCEGVVGEKKKKRKERVQKISEKKKKSRRRGLTLVDSKKQEVWILSKGENLKNQWTGRRG